MKWIKEMLGPTDDPEEVFGAFLLFMLFSCGAIVGIVAIICDTIKHAK